MIPTLAVAFILLLLAAIVYGFGIVMRRPLSRGELAMETCTLCRRKFDKGLLIERPVGDQKMLFFCRECIEELHSEAARHNGSASSKILK